MGTDQDDLVLIPLRTCWRRLTGNQDISQIQVSAFSDSSTQKVQRDTQRLLRERRHTGPHEEGDFSVRDMKKIVAMLTGTTRVLTMLLGAVAAVSLLVGGLAL